MPNEMLLPESEGLPQAGNAGMLPGQNIPQSPVDLDRELDQLAAVLRTQAPSPNLQRSLMDAAFAAGDLRMPDSPSNAGGNARKQESFGMPGWVSGWGFAAVAAGVCLCALLIRWDAIPGALVAQTPPPAPGSALIGTPEPESAAPLLAAVPRQTVVPRQAVVPGRARQIRKPVESSGAGALAVAANLPVQPVATPAEAMSAQDAEAPVAPPWDERDLLGAGARTHLAAFPLTAPMPLTSGEPLQTLRIRVAAEDLWRMGFYAEPPARNQPMLADFLLGEDGRPLGVRLVGMGY